MLYAGLQLFFVFREFFDAVFVNFNFKLHAGEHLPGVDLEVLYLLLDGCVVANLGKAAQLIIQAQVFKASDELGHLFFGGAAENQIVNKDERCKPNVDDLRGSQAEQ